MKGDGDVVWRCRRRGWREMAWWGVGGDDGRCPMKKSPVDTTRLDSCSKAKSNETIGCRSRILLSDGQQLWREIGE